MNSRFFIDSYKIPSHKGERVQSSIQLLEDFNVDKPSLLVQIDSTQEVLTIPTNQIQDNLLIKIETAEENFYYTFKERSLMDDEEAESHAISLVKEEYPKELEILLRDYPDKFSRY